LILFSNVTFLLLIASKLSTFYSTMNFSESETKKKKNLSR
jgi:hypothetical protein